MSMEEMTRSHRLKIGPISQADLTATASGQVTGTALQPGWHAIVATGADAHVLQCNAAGAAAVTGDPTLVLSKGRHLPAGTEYRFFVDDKRDDGLIAYVRSAGTNATLRVSKTDAVFGG